MQNSGDTILFIGAEIDASLTCPLLKPGVFILGRIHPFFFFFADQPDGFRRTGGDTKTAADAPISDDTIGLLALLYSVHLAALVRTDATGLA